MTSISTPQIDAVVHSLAAEVDAARRRTDRRGWFAAMYLQTTRTVRDRAAAGFFDDAERMDRFVEAFAGRYLGPLHASLAGEPVPRCWAVAFDLAERSDRVILQHLLLGINAHVNLDLSVVAAETSTPSIGASPSWPRSSPRPAGSSDGPSTWWRPPSPTTCRPSSTPSAG